MQNLFLELTLLSSLAVIVYLLSAALPRVGEHEDEDDSTRRANLPLDRLDQLLLKTKDKFLRKMKVFVMKADNLISRQLKGKKEQQ